MRFFSTLIALTISLGTFAQGLPIHRVHTRATNSFNNGAVQTVAYDKYNSYVYYTNVAQNKVYVYDYTDITKPKLMHILDLSPYISTITGVDAIFGEVAVVGYSNPQSSGKLMFFDEKGNPLAQFPTGAMPKAVKFNLTGSHIVTVCEGAPSSDYSIDPKAFITVLSLSAGVSNTPVSSVVFLDFEELDSTSYDPAIRVFGNGGTQAPSLDLEPEAIGFVTNGKAYVSLQENNAVAVLDVFAAEIDTVFGLGYKDFSSVGLDASDLETSIDIKPYFRLFGMYQPDEIDCYNVNGNNYFLTANEGAYRDYSSYSELATTSDFVFNSSTFPNAATLYADTGLGRLQLTNTMGNFDNDLFQDSLFCFGGRSFSIWDENGQLIWDSGDEFEQLTAQLFASDFNSSADDNNSRKSRSNKMGPQPESIVVGEVDGTPYAFIGLKEMGGFMVYDISDPTNPQFELYELNRDFNVSANDANAGDLGISSLEFVPANVSPTGFALLLVANEVSGTLSTYEMGIGIGLNEGFPIVEEGLYPNPSNGVFNTTQAGNYKIYNVEGKLVKTVSRHNVIDLSDQPNGIYIIKNEEGVALRAMKK